MEIHLRTVGSAHPQARELARPLLGKFMSMNYITPNTFPKEDLWEQGLKC